MSTPTPPLTTPSDDEGAKEDNSGARVRPETEDMGGDVKQLADWVGIETDHRRVLEAGQDGWFHPRSGGFVLGRKCFVSEPDSAAMSNAIRVRLVFDAQKLPLFFGDSKEGEQTPALGDSHEGTVARWYAPVPLYAVTRMEVSSHEERARLLALIEEFSNVSLPEAEIDVGATEVRAAAAGDQANVVLPESLDAIQGAMAMAAWAVPRVDPWIETLQWALNQDADGATRKLRALAAPWLRFPWCDDPKPVAGDGETQLWRAAVTSLRSPTAAGKSPSQLAETIAEIACDEGRCETTENWLRRTRRIVSAEDSFERCENDAGLAIQLVLLRPEPMDFRTWSRELPWLPPGVWWAAAVLCGWRHGYRSLDRRFRGTAVLRELLATRALAVSWASPGDIPLPTAQRTSLEWRREDGCFSLIWGERQVLRKRWHARAKWYTADLSDATVEKAARQLARELGWECFTQRLQLQDVRIPLSGAGSLELDGNRYLVATGHVDLELPARARLADELDKDGFRRALASEAGVVPDPPTGSTVQEEAVPGLVYRPEFITSEEERELVAWLDEHEWSRPLKRRVQQYGWRYDYRQREIDARMRLGELPDWAAALAQRLVNEELMDERPDQVIVNEYKGAQGISRHIDQPHSFAERVATISLLETWSMVFRLPNSKRKVEKSLESRSVAVFTGDARYRWTHEIPGRKYERVGSDRQRVRRERRISLTFRKVKAIDGELFALAGEVAI